MTRPAALLFDLDGTLVDTRADLALAINRVRASLGLPAQSEAHIASLVGNGAAVLVQRAIAPDTDDATAERVFPDFIREYTDVCTHASQLYPGIRELLDAVAGWTDVPAAIVTNKPEAITHKLLDALELSHYFRLVIGGDTLASHKPDPEGVRLVCREFGVDPARAMLIGDSPVDANTAVAAPCRMALCYWGFSTTEALDACDAGLRATTAADLHTALVAL